MKYEAAEKEKELQKSQKKATANTLYLESILHASTETAIVATDTNLRINFFNEKAEHIFGMTRETVLGKTIFEIHALKGSAGPNAKYFKNIIEEVHQTGSYAFTMSFGEISIDALMSTIKDHSDVFVGFLLMVNDITERARMDEELRQLSRAVEQSHSTIVISDLNGDIEFVNPSFTRTTGYSADEILGKNLRIMKSGYQEKSFYREMWDTLNQGKVWKGEIRNRRKDSSLFWEYATISPVKNEKGDITHYVAIKEDITSRKKIEFALQESQEQLQSYIMAIDDLGLGMLVIDSDYHIRDMNITSMAWFGDQRGTICHQSISNRDQPCTVCHLRTVIDKGTNIRYQPTSVLEGKTLDILATRVLNSDKGFSKLEIIRDITEQEEAKAELQEANIQLTKSIGTAKMLTHKAESANQAKASFLANMSHEIRTPMNSIIGRTNLALEDPIDDTTRAHLEMIASSSNSLLTLLNDILDFSKIEAGELVIVSKPFDLHDTVESCFRTVNILLEDKQKKVVLTCTMAKNLPQVCIGDPLRVRQILLNLLTNSVKFTEEGSIDIFVDLLKQEDDLCYVQFKIQDTGVGIAANKLEHVFGQFTQADDSTTRNYGGTGLGLAICRQLCQLMNGTIAVESVADRGSAFSVQIPLQRCEIDDLPKKKRTDESEQVVSKALSLLLVEDNDANLVMAKMVLEKWNHRITVAHNGLKALEALADNDFDIVLMDVQMPVMDGLTTSSAIRTAECGERVMGVDESLAGRLAARLRNQHIPIIAMTANAMSGDREKCIEAGMDLYLSKPFKIVDVQDALAEACQIRHQAGKRETVKSLGVLEQRIISHLKKNYEFDDQQCTHMRNLFMSTTQEILESAEEARREKSRSKFSSAGHKLKGVFLNYGLSELVKQAEVIEANESMQTMTQELDALQDYFKKLIAVKSDKSEVK